MNLLHIGLRLVALAGFVSAQAGEPVADLALSLSVEPGSSISPGTEGTIRLSISNFGPSPAFGIFRWTPTAIGDQFGYPPLEFTGAAGPCGVSPVGQPPPGDLFGFQVTPEMAAGEKVDCVYQFRVLETKVFNQIAQLDVAPLESISDPDDSNNVAEVLLVFSDLGASRPVPLLSSWGVPALIVLIALLAFFHRTRFSKSAR